MVESEVGVLQRQEAANHQVRAYEQREAERHLDDGQPALHPLCARSEGHRPAVVLQITDHAGPGSAQRWQQTGGDRSEDGDSCGEENHADVRGEA